MVPSHRRSRARTRAAGAAEFWAHREADGSYRVGFTQATQRRLGSVVFFRGPDAGRKYRPRQPAMTLESEKCVRQIALPAGAFVVESNRDLEGNPAAINRDPYGAGWVCRLRPNRSATFESATERPPRTRR